MEHFKIEEMLTVKCILVKSSRLRDRRFVLKQITKEQLDIYEFRLKRLEFKAVRSPERLLNREHRPTLLNIADAWAELPP